MIYLTFAQSWFPLGFIFSILLAFFSVYFHKHFLSFAPTDFYKTFSRSFVTGVFMELILVSTSQLQPGPLIAHSHLLLAGDLILMWVIFSATLCSAFFGLRQNRWLFVAICGIFGPLAYFYPASQQFIVYAQPLWLSIGIQSLLWGTWGYVNSAKI
jgi:hypothetical protein